MNIFKNKLFNDLSEIDVISKDLSLFYNHTRDIKNLKTYKCNKTNSLILERIDHILNEYYYLKKESRSLVVGDSKVNINRPSEDLSRHTKMIKKFMINEQNNYWLDYGCGKGELLECIKEKNILKFGLEINPDRLSILKKKEINAFDDLKSFDQNFDIISMFHVIEHLFDPIETLRLLKTKMKKNSTLVIETPNAQNLLLNLPNYDSFKNFSLWSEHLILYSQFSLERLLKYIFPIKNYIHKCFGVQRYSLLNTFYWLYKKKPNGQNILKDFDNEQIQFYEEYLKKINSTDTLVYYINKN